jgi:hypothetical protein
MIRLVGILGFSVMAQPAMATEPVCPPVGLYYEVEDVQQILRIVPSCLGDPEDVGKALAVIARIVIDAHQDAFPNQSYVAVEEVLVESFVSEILEPSVPAPAN